jgi:RNA polymerase sigma-70 factor (ECF subfamily)
VPSASIPDEEVVRRVRAGELALFELLMRRHNPRVYRAIRSILRDEGDVEDAMQQSYLQAFAGLDGYSGASAVSTWLVRIAINEALMRVRKQGRLEIVEDVSIPAEDSMDAPPPTPEDRAATREAIRLVEAAVDQLPLIHRTTFMLRDVQGLSTAEAAECLGVSEETVKIRLHRARNALRDALFAQVGPSAAAAFPFLAPRCNRVVAAVLARVASGSGKESP